MPTDPKIDLSDKTIKLTDLLEWLLSDEAGEAQPAGEKRDAKESR
jgi:hypothetical protein